MAAMNWESELSHIPAMPASGAVDWEAELTDVPVHQEQPRGLSEDERRKSMVIVEHERALAQAHKTLGESNLPGVKAYAIGAGADIVSPVARLLGQSEYADEMNRWGAAVEEAQQEREAGGIVPDILQRGIRGAGRSLTSMGGAAMVAGPYGAIAAAAGQEGNRAITEGRDAGLSGGALAGYAVTQGVVEGLPAAAMQRIGLGGTESLVAGKGAISVGIKEGLKRIGISYAQELPEELITELSHSVVSSLSEVDPQSLSTDNLKRMVADTTVQTLLTVGLAGAPGLARSYAEGKPTKTREAILKAADEGRTPSRAEWKQWGLPAADGKKASQRKVGVASLAEQMRAVQEPAAEEVGPAEEQPPIGRPAETQPAPEQPVAPEVPPRGVESPPESAAPDAMTEGAPTVTGIKNELADELRAGRGEAAISRVQQETQVEWLDRAEQKIKADPSFPNRLVDEVIAKPRAISDEETAALQLHYRGLNNDFATVTEKLFAASESGDIATRMKAQVDSKWLLAELQKVEEASRAAGREWGRAGVARQMELKADFSLGGLVRRARVAKGGETLTLGESAKIKELGDKVAELQSKLDVRSAERQEQDSIKAVDDTIAEFVPKKRFKKRTPSIKKIEAQKHVQDAWADFKSKLLGGAGEGFIRGESGALDVELLASGGRLVEAYADLGVATFSEFWSSARAALGDVADTAKGTLRQAWENAQEAGIIPKLEVDPGDSSAVSKLAKKTARSLIEAGVRGRDEVVDAVHGELQAAVPGITRRQVMDAISGYGQYSELSKDEVSTVVRDINGQLQQLAKLEDMQRGKAPKKTGIQRREPSDEERRLIQQVNEAKKRGGFDVTDPEKQLKSALDTAKTAVRNRIADLGEEIKARQKNVVKRNELKPDAELEALRKRRDELKAEHAAIFPKEPATREQKITAASKALDRAIGQLEGDLKAGRIGIKKRPKPLSTPELDAKRATLEALRAQRDELREAANPRASPEERQLAAYKRGLTNRLADLKRRIAEGDFSKKKISRVVPDKEAIDLKYQIKAERDKFSAMEESWRKSQLKGMERAWDLAGESMNFTRAVMTSFDFSAVLRQGGLAVYSRPWLAAKAAPEMLRAFVSRKSELAAIESLRNHPDARLAEESKLAITVSEGKLTQQEEAFRGKWAARVPGVAASERAYVTFLNRMRMEMFSSMVNAFGASGKATADEARVIANAVNVFTGRGNFTGANSAAAQAASTYFFSPRYVASRFQVLLGQPLWGGNARTRKLIAKEYARSLTGLGTFFGALAISGLFATDKDDKPKFEFDPRSVEFGKVRFGDTIIDPLAGLSQITVFMTRLAGGRTKMSTGEVVPIRGREVPFKGLTTSDVIARFMRSKLAPVPGAMWNVLAGENVIGEETGLPGEIGKLTVPLSFGDIADAMKTKGVEKKAVLSALVLLGVGVQNYQNATPDRFATKIAQHPRLRGFSERTKKKYDYNKQVNQVVAEAKKRGLTETELKKAVVKKMRESGKSDDAIIDWMRRLHYRFNRQPGGPSSSQ